MQQQLTLFWVVLFVVAGIMCIMVPAFLFVLFLVGRHQSRIEMMEMAYDDEPEINHAKKRSRKTKPRFRYKIMVHKRRKRKQSRHNRKLNFLMQKI